MLSVFLPGAQCADEAPDARKPPSDLQRLIAAIGTEPLFVIGISDVQSLPELFSKTTFSQMLVDPTYEKGLATIKALLNESCGVDLTDLAARSGKLMDGPAAIVVTANTEGFAYTYLVQTKSEENARQLAALWSSVKDSTRLFSLLKLKTLLPQDLVAADALPEWAVKNWSVGDIFINAYPRKIAKAIENAIADGKLDTKAKSHLLTDVYTWGVDRVALGITFNGESFTDSLTLEIAPDANKTFAHVIAGLKEKPKGWDSLLAAMPSDGDITVLLQSDPKVIADELPFAFQPLERYLRGKRWAKSVGVSPESLDPKRFGFLIDHLHGEVGITVKPTLTAELHLLLAAAMKPGEVETIQTDMSKGLSEMNAPFDTLQGVPKIGNTAPLGAHFQGRGIFTAPVIGLSPGWAWLCSNSSTYQDLTSNFAKGHTLLNAFKAENARLNAGGGIAEVWNHADALRIQINLDKVVQPAYTAWLLSGEDGPFIAGWRVPSDMLPPPPLFAGRLGNLRIGLGRTGQTLSGYSHSFIPGTSVVAFLLLQVLALEIDGASAFAKSPPPPPLARTAPIKKKSKKDDSDAAGEDNTTKAAKTNSDQP